MKGLLAIQLKNKLNTYAIVSERLIGLTDTYDPRIFSLIEGSWAVGELVLDP